MNGSGGFCWYLPRHSRSSAKFKRARLDVDHELAVVRRGHDGAPQLEHVGRRAVLAYEPAPDLGRAGHGAAPSNNPVSPVG